MIICILGDYGAGKDTFADLLVKHLPESQKIKSYTTRQPRYEGEDTHTFIPHEECPLKPMNIPDNWVAYNIIDNNIYWTTKKQFSKKYNIYVIDDIGLEQVLTSKLDYTFIIEIKRPEHLNKVSESRKQRKTPFKNFDYTFNIDYTIINDKDIEALEGWAQLIAKKLLNNY